MDEGVAIHGSCDARFARVRETFEAGFASGAEVGAAVAVEVAGERVVDLWAGVRDRAKALPWERDTLVNVFSTTKGMTALCAHLLIDEGLLDLDEPVARYWPEFAVAGKAAVSIRQLLSHQAGLPAIRETLPPEALFDWSAMTEALAAEEPWWTPGTRHGYHALTFGWLVGELVRRVSGRSLGTYFRETLAEPLGADFFIGLPAELDERVADLIQGPFAPPPPGSESMLQAIMRDRGGMLARAFTNPALTTLPLVASRAWRAAEIPAANGHASAVGIARIYGALARGELLGTDALDAAREEQVYGKDAVIPLVTRIANGFMLTPEEEPCGPNPRAFNHAGAGGSLGYCDPEAQVGFGYAMNHMHVGAWLIDPRARALVAALYEAL